MPRPNDMRILPSIYADDYAAWKTGKSIEQLGNSVQAHLDQIIQWTDTWGFKLNTEKSVTALFTNNKKLQSAVNLSIKGHKLKMEAEIKFLGVTYDQCFTWKSHITNVVNRTKKAYHLMRKLSGQKWGASKRALLTVYQALVRSRLD